jgi:hypothetical protein
VCSGSEALLRSGDYQGVHSRVALRRFDLFEEIADYAARETGNSSGIFEREEKNASDKFRADVSGGVRHGRGQAAGPRTCPARF